MKLKYLEIKDDGLLYSKKEAKTIEEAWEKTIEKWTFRAKNPFIRSEEEATTCGLCNLFYERTKESYYCDGCPVRLHTGKALCGNTPYDTWATQELKDFPDPESTTQAAKDELGFLLHLYAERSNSDEGSEA